MRYLLANNVRFVPVAKSGSAMLAHAILKTHHRSDYDRVLSGLHKPASVELKDVFFQGICPYEDKPTAPVVIALREPIERFRSAAAFLASRGQVKTVDAWLDLVEQGKADQHLEFQHKKVKEGFSLYKFPEHLDALKSVLELDETWVANASDPETKPDLTPEQIARIEAIYAADIELYNSIETAGQVYIKPTSLEELNSQKNNLIEQVRQKRQQIEQGGFEFNGLTIPSDRESQAMLNGAVVAAKDDPSFTTMWQVDSKTFIPLDAATIIALGVTLRNHVNGAFLWQATTVQQIMSAETMEALEGIEV